MGQDGVASRETPSDVEPGGVEAGADALPPVSPFTSAAHRIAAEAADERALRQKRAEEREKERTRGS